MALIQDLGRHCIVLLGALTFPLCSVTGLFAALICPVVLRGAREQEIFLALLAFKALSSG